ncbi:uncharacterized protein AB675_10450 [Cyphellophora attinorum]|uniref:Uncharacterized protein n=1 Tax=Cyphellophora attinorum TaxID=1664694 RepID=A0A0N1HIK8_9EURO|nr:uncharacterized protein AB675_10450 [Phialophora attinorum]KPI35943.1 hypothetical protein AB675_10450 [Phialophora attinorum]
MDAGICDHMTWVTLSATTSPNGIGFGLPSNMVVTADLLSSPRLVVDGNDSLAGDSRSAVPANYALTTYPSNLAEAVVKTPVKTPALRSGTTPSMNKSKGHRNFQAENMAWCRGSDSDDSPSWRDLLCQPIHRPPPWVNISTTAAVVWWVGGLTAAA